MKHGIVCGIGIVGEGDFSRCGTPKVYFLWSAMLARCNDPKVHERQATYKGCSVHKRWHNLQNFGADIVKMKNWDTPGFELDKDLRVSGNKVYGPKTCCFVPHEVNSIYASINANGIKRNGSGFQARIRNDGIQVSLGTFPTIEQAKIIYARHKTKQVRLAAKVYRRDIHVEAYKTLATYEHGTGG